MTLKYEIRFRDIDPDTGAVTKDELVAVSPDLKMAELVWSCLHTVWFSTEGPNDPNREFYFKETD